MWYWPKWLKNAVVCFLIFILHINWIFIMLNHVRPWYRNWILHYVNLTSTIILAWPWWFELSKTLYFSFLFLIELELEFWSCLHISAIKVKVKVKIHGSWNHLCILVVRCVVSLLFYMSIYCVSRDYLGCIFFLIAIYDRNVTSVKYL